MENGKLFRTILRHLIWRDSPAFLYLYFTHKIAIHFCFSCSAYISLNLRQLQLRFTHFTKPMLMVKISRFISLFNSIKQLYLLTIFMLLQGKADNVKPYHVILIINLQTEQTCKYIHCVV